MADSKITALTSISTSTDPANDPLVIVDVSDTSMAASGTTKKVTLNQLLGASGTATLASATITGNLTVNGSYISCGNNSYIRTDAANLFSIQTGSLGFRIMNAGNSALFYGIDSASTSTWYDGAGGTRMTLNSTGLGVGTSPSYKLHVNGTDTTNVLFNGATKGVRFVASASKYSITGVDNTGAATFQPLAIGGASLEFQIGSTTQMTLDASGILVVGNTAAASVGATGGWLASPNSGNSYTLIGHNSGSASGSTYSYYFYNSSPIGSITQSGTTGVAYNTTSDYRLKEAVQPITGALSRISALKPSIYKWKADGSNGEGFLAHELAEAVPLAVTGEKDAVNDDGSIKPQQVDLSKVVPVLVAAIQELAARVQTLETR